DKLSPNDCRERLENVDKLDELVARGAVFYISHSGGKDSQAMYALLSRVVPEKQISVIHADLGEVEWHGVHGADERPELYARYLEIEEETGWTMFNGKSPRERVEGARAADP